MRLLWPSPPWDAVTYWALDLETGGLDPKRDPILAVGMVPVRERTIRLGDGVLLVHQAALDVRFLKRAYRAVGLRWRSPRVVDTVDLLMRLAKKARFIDPGAQEAAPVLNLTAARRRLGLPDYAAHDALTDAIAAAELFLVLRKALGARTLRDVR